MREFYLFLIVFAWTVSTGSFLRCYQCYGPEDGQSYPRYKCEEEQEAVTCPSEKTNCGRYYHTIKSGVLTHEVDGRSCITEDECPRIGLSCKAIIMAGGQCEYTCCNKDFCNAAPTPHKSSQSVLLSIFLFFFFYPL